MGFSHPVGVSSDDFSERVYVQMLDVAGGLSPQMAEDFKIRVSLSVINY